MDLQFPDDAIEEIARIAAEVNERTENIGARRLHTVHGAAARRGVLRRRRAGGQRIVIDAAYVRERLEGIVKDEDLSRYIL